jgi:polygalacturonase
VTITNCFVSGYDMGTMLDGTFQTRAGGAPDRGGPTGRIKLGTESSGGFKNITISNCVFEHSRGLALETVDGGDLEDVTVSNLTMRDIVNSPIFLRLGRRMRSPEGAAIGHLRRVNISDIIVSNADPRSASLITGIPGHPIEDVKLSRIRILYRGGGTKAQAAIVPPEGETDYPEPQRFGEMPAYGFFIRHVAGIEFNDVVVGFEKTDLRPSFQLDDVKGADFNNVKPQRAGREPAFVLHEVTDFRTWHCLSLPDEDLKEVTHRSL